jgi:hypothetical protein
MLADVPAGESPVGGACSVATVVIPDDEKGDRLAESSGVKAPVGWEKYPVGSAKGASNSTGRSEVRTKEAAKGSSHRKRMMGHLGVPSRCDPGEGQRRWRRN